MGGRGAFLESGGFAGELQWRTVGYIEGIKVLEPKNKSSKNLPEFSNTPGTSYIKLDAKDCFSQLRVYDEKRKPLFDIDYGQHQGKKSLHIHYHNGSLSYPREANILRPGDAL